MNKRFLVVALYKSEINKKQPTNENTRTVYAGPDKTKGIQAFSKYVGNKTSMVGRIYILDETLEFEPPVLKRTKHL